MSLECIHSLHQIRFQNELCVNLKADCAIVCDGVRSVAGYGARITSYHLASPAMKVSIVVTTMTMRSPERSLI